MFTLNITSLVSKLISPSNVFEVISNNSKYFLETSHHVTTRNHQYRHLPGINIKIKIIKSNKTNNTSISNKYRKVFPKYNRNNREESKNGENQPAVMGDSIV